MSVEVDFAVHGGGEVREVGVLRVVLGAGGECAGAVGAGSVFGDGAGGEVVAFQFGSVLVEQGRVRGVGVGRWDFVFDVRLVWARSNTEGWDFVALPYAVE